MARVKLSETCVSVQCCGVDQRFDENAPTVHSTQAELHDDRCNSNSPAVSETICGHGFSPFLNKNDGMADPAKAYAFASFR